MRSKEVWRTCVILAYSSDVNKQHVQCTDVDTIRCIWSREFRLLGPHNGDMSVTHTKAVFMEDVFCARGEHRAPDNLRLGAGCMSNSIFR